MSENQGERPEENVPPAPAEDAARTPADPDTPAPAPLPPHPGPAPQFTPPSAAGGWHPAGAPRPPYTGSGQPGYDTPPRARYAGQPAGQSFGPAAAQPTQPTVALASGEAASPRKKSGAGRIVGLIVAAALVGGAAGLGGTYAGLSMWGGSDGAPVAGPQTITVNDPENVNATTAIAAKVVPSVVTISASSGNGGGTGSGVILSEDGYVLTNTHVVTLDGQAADARITATTSDGRVYDAEVVGTDPIYDLAVIKLQDASGLTPIEVADSDDLNVGDETVAVGAPLGLSNTVTTGIVSALNRSISVASAAVPDEAQGDDETQQPGEESPFFFDFGEGQQAAGTGETISIAVIQTDAAINPGNSGGALVDSEGRLIGINVAIASAGGSSSGQSGNIGVGFAIPSSIAQRVADEIIEDGSATHGLLGATVQPASSVEGTDIAGAYIGSVVPDGAAAQAGLQEGDIVTEFDGKPITNSVDLTAQVRALAAGSEATLTYVRDGESHTADVTLGELGS
jgi:putative serine protease PepD